MVVLADDSEAVAQTVGDFFLAVEPVKPPQSICSERTGGLVAIPVVCVSDGLPVRKGLACDTVTVVIGVACI